MLFNSVDFAFFLPVVFFLYWFVFQRNLKLQNGFIILASYLFYGWWDWRFVTLIFLSSSIDFVAGLNLNKQNGKHRRLWLITSLTANLGLLFFFKYYDFFAQSFADAFTLFGGHMEVGSLEIILPVGISFYTFQTLSYTIDIYRGRMQATKDPLAFFAFVSFFPQLVAGPIERASHLLPQLLKKRTFSYSLAVDGMQQIIWGLFKKVVIADNCAVFANEIFHNYSDYEGSTLLIGAVFFAFQIYGDFSGYSDIAIGTSKLFGIELNQNFAFPYFSRDIAEFWRRWHISLSTWFRDYVYIPLGGSKTGTGKAIRNIFIVFVVSGFWHGANWTFIAWGFLNALYFLPLFLLKNNRKHTNTVGEGRLLPSLSDLARISVTFGLTTFAWIFFRADNMQHAYSFIGGIFSSSLFHSPIKDLWAMNTGNQIILLGIALCFMVGMEWLHREKQYGLKLSVKVPKVIRWALYYGVVIACFVMNGVQQEFIYFQF